MGDLTVIRQGMMLYWAQSLQVFSGRRVVDYLVHDTLMALMGGGLALLIIWVDQLSNPWLRTGPHLRRWNRLSAEVAARRADGASRARRCCPAATWRSIVSPAAAAREPATASLCAPIPLRTARPLA